MIGNDQDRRFRVHVQNIMSFKTRGRRLFVHKGFFGESGHVYEKRDNAFINHILMLKERYMPKGLVLQDRNNPL